MAKDHGIRSTLLTGVTMGTLLGVLFGLLEACFLVASKVALFETGTAKPGLFFDGASINGAAGFALGLIFSIVAVISLPSAKDTTRSSLTASLLVPTFLVTILSIKIAPATSPVPFMKSEWIAAFFISAVLVYGAARFVSRKFEKSTGRPLFVKGIWLALGVILIATYGIAFLERWAVSNKPSPAQGRPNILVIMIDAARPDRFSCYGYSRKTTPNIDAVAKESTLFKNAYAQTNWTEPSVSCIFTGKYVSQIGVTKQYAYLDDEHVTIAELLRDDGYLTAAFTNSPWISRATNLDKGFSYFMYMGQRFEGKRYFSFYRVSMLIDAGIRKLIGRGDNKGTRKTLRMVKKWLQEYGFRGSPFFLFVHIIDTHASYEPPKPFDTLFFEPSTHYRPFDQRRYISSDEEIPKNVPEEYIPVLNNLYDGELAYCDSQLGELFRYLRSSSLWDSTALVIMADHGQYLSEHERFGHDYGLYETVIRIPLIIKFPKTLQQRPVVRDRVESVDLFPTFSQIASIGSQEALPGQSLASPRTKKTVFCESDDGLQRCLIDHNMKLLSSKNKEDEVYDLEGDPEETRDLARSRSDIREALRNELDEFVSRYGVVDLSRKRNSAFDKAETDTLKSLGYLQ